MLGIFLIALLCRCLRLHVCRSLPEAVTDSDYTERPLRVRTYPYIPYCVWLRELLQQASGSVVDQLDPDAEQGKIADLIEHLLLQSALDDHTEPDTDRHQRQ